VEEKDEIKEEEKGESKIEQDVPALEPENPTPQWSKKFSHLWYKTSSNY